MSDSDVTVFFGTNLVRAASPLLTLRSAAPLLYGEQTRPLVILLLFGLGYFHGQIHRLLEEVHQRLLSQQRRQDLSVADSPLALQRRTAVATAAAAVVALRTTGLVVFGVRLQGSCSLLLLVVDL